MVVFVVLIDEGRHEVVDKPTLRNFSVLKRYVKQQRLLVVSRGASNDLCVLVTT